VWSRPFRLVKLTSLQTLLATMRQPSYFSPGPEAIDGALDQRTVGGQPGVPGHRPKGMSRRPLEAAPSGSLTGSGEPDSGKDRLGRAGRVQSPVPLLALDLFWNFRPV
jgi:hypothetical protein